MFFFVGILFFGSSQAGSGAHSTLDFIIAGTQKGGTTALGNSLRKDATEVCLTHGEYHGLDFVNAKKHFVGSSKRRILNSETSCNKTSPRVRYGIESPLFMFTFTDAQATALKRNFPGIKLIILLREPIQRAFSQYKMEKAKGWKGTFAEVVQASIAAGPEPRTRKKFYGSYGHKGSIVWRGFYAEQLDRIYSNIDKGRIHIAISERVFSGPAGRHQVYNEVLDFIGAPHVEEFGNVFTRPAAKCKSAEPGCNLDLGVAQVLRDLYANDTRALYQRVGVIQEWEDWYKANGLPPTQV